MKIKMYEWGILSAMGYSPLWCAESNLYDFLCIFLDRNTTIWEDTSPCDLKPGMINLDMLNTQFLSSDGGKQTHLVFLLQIVKALEHLHSKLSVIHRGK